VPAPRARQIILTTAERHRLSKLACSRTAGATIRRDLIDVAARTARHGRGHITLHLPAGWHRAHD
jgi:hypothetical protein